MYYMSQHFKRNLGILRRGNFTPNSSKVTNIELACIAMAILVNEVTLMYQYHIWQDVATLMVVDS